MEDQESIQRYFIELSYHGGNYHGWQIQKNAVTIQEVLQNAISTILRSKIELTGAGRTDTGVHAKFFVAHFDFPTSKKQPENLVYKLNSYLPDDIAIHKIYKVDNEKHSRFSAVSRTYEYLITQKKDPFLQGMAYYFNRPLDVALMHEAAQGLFNFKDFTSFSKLHSQTKTNHCKIYRAEWIKRMDKQLIFTIEADRFLRNMVRAIVGTLIELGQGKLTIQDFCRIVKAKDRSKAGFSAPDQGLYLSHITYNWDEKEA